MTEEFKKYFENTAFGDHVKAYVVVTFSVHGFHPFADFKNRPPDQYNMHYNCIVLLYIVIFNFNFLRVLRFF